MTGAQASGTAAAVINASLNDVSCTSPSSCVAVGWDQRSPTGGSVLFTLAETWNGTAWRHVSTPTPGNSGVLGGVSCTSATACIAGGDHATPNNPTMVNATL